MKKLSIEVGPRSSPLIGELRDSLLDQNSKVVFVEKRAWTKNLKNVVPHADVIQADGSEMPLDDKSADLVFAKDLFGSDNQAILLPGTNKMETERIAQTMPDEWSRVLKNGGKVVVYEQSTPPQAGVLRDSFEKRGFRTLEENRGTRAADVFRSRKAFLKTLRQPGSENSFSLVLENLR